jgi:hypothetical protein
MDWLVWCGCHEPDALCVRESLVDAGFVDGDFLNEHDQLLSYWHSGQIMLENCDPSSPGTCLSELPNQLVMGDWCFNRFGLELLSYWVQSRSEICNHPLVKRSKNLKLATCFRMVTVNCLCIFPQGMRLNLAFEDDQIRAEMRGCDHCCMLTPYDSKGVVAGTLPTKNDGYLGITLRTDSVPPSDRFGRVSSTVTGWAFGVIKDAKNHSVLIGSGLSQDLEDDLRKELREVKDEVKKLKWSMAQIAKALDISQECLEKREECRMQFHKSIEANCR